MYNINMTRYGGSGHHIHSWLVSCKLIKGLWKTLPTKVKHMPISWLSKSVADIPKIHKYIDPQKSDIKECLQLLYS